MRKCPTDETLDDYLRERLSEPESARFEGHYFNCPKCFRKTRERSELLGVIRSRGASLFAPGAAGRSGPGASRRRPWPDFLRRPGAAAAVAAGLVLIAGAVLVFRSGDRPPAFVLTDRETVRGEALVLLAPIGDVAGAPLTFTWKTAGAGLEFQLTVSGPEFEWTTTTENLRVEMPAAERAKLRTGTAYAWKVKAFTPQGILAAGSRTETFKVTAGRGTTAP
jgi:hypothetical protein